jgi:transketolase
VEARVINVSTIKPLNESEVFAYAEGVQTAFTVEEHNIIGGLGSAVAEVLSSRAKTPLVRLGVRDVFGESATADELLEKHGLQPRGLCQAVMGALR